MVDGLCRFHGCEQPATAVLVGFGGWLDERCPTHARQLIDWHAARMPTMQLKQMRSATGRLEAR